MEEIWKEIKENPNYMVSNMGRVKSLNYHRTGKEEILKPTKNKGYLRVNLYKNGKLKNFQVHRLVAEAFIPNPNNYPQINHKSEIKTQNNVENLEWCDHLYNCNYGTRNKRVSESRFKPVLQIDKNTNNVITEFPSLNEINRQFGYSQGHISECCLGKRKTAYGFKWKFKKSVA